MADTGCPPGFKPLFRTSPFLDATGPYFYKPEERGFVVGLRVETRHTNNTGTVHGGLLATMADVSLGYVTAMSQQPPVRMLTTSLGLDYVGTANVGDWLEAHVSVVKVGSRLAFANLLIVANAAPIVTARATFLVTEPTATR
ncbi:MULTISPECIES: PaaI family thioesterase [Hydrogenophaga]|uniref:PaaI family thioesterase n=2 Tax=Hydrogenophaga TaxID=47420 RepID=A0ABW2QRY9_9BURK